MLDELARFSKVVGVKQVRRAVIAGTAKVVWLADDADPEITQPIATLCEEKGVPIEVGHSMKELGHACGIAVGAAVVATLV